jgi:two-component system sensor histidine kinase BarA
MFLKLNKIRLNTLIIVIVTSTVSLLMAFYFSWDLYSQNKQGLNDLHNTTTLMAKQLMATHIFIENNQNLINNDKNGHFNYKNLIPSVAVREISEIFNKTMGYTFKQTSLTVRNPVNKPDPFETNVLNRMIQNPQLTEFASTDTLNGSKVYRYMVPLYQDSNCLICHGEPKGQLDITGYPKEGAHLGELAGAISIVAPLDGMYKNIRNRLLQDFISILILLLTLTAILYFVIRKTVVQPLENVVNLSIRIGNGQLEMLDVIPSANYEVHALYDSFYTMASKLRDSYSTLEAKVDERTSELLTTNTKLSKANDVKSEFIAMMSHELQTPLTSIIAYSEFLLEEGTDHEETTEYVYDIYESALHLLDLITDILDFSKIQNNKVRLHTSLFEVSEVSMVLERIFEPLIKKKRLSFTLDIPTELPALEADKNKIKQILMNLLSNAIKFTSEEGHLHLKAVYLPSTDEILISLTDTGRGIGKDRLLVIFDKFTQADPLTTREFGGLGLGLAVAQQMVQLHGGRIWVESVIGKGSTFYFTIPIVPPITMI